MASTTEWQCDFCAHVNERDAQACADCGVVHVFEGLLAVAEADDSVGLNWGETKPFLLGVTWCASWSEAIIGMFEAIRARPRPVERHYWTSEVSGVHYYDCWCPGCGVQMKGRLAGQCEGTDDEWCGSCRY